ncbi:Major facilitator sugar transporter-like [Trinorchestia longiramus]|nr:Major facilitator sugar transporter-like [Trinorchestia longiramus]
MNGGVSVTGMAYIVEISDDVMRGPLTLVSSVSLYLGRKADARKYLLRLRTQGADVDAQIQSYVDLNQAFQNTKLIDSLKNRKVIKNLSVVFVLFIIQACSGYPVFSVQTARVLQYSGSTIDPTTGTIAVQAAQVRTVDPTTGTIAVQAAQIVGVVLAMLCVTKLGRRGTLMVSQSVMGLSVCALAVYVHLMVPSSTLTHSPNHYANNTMLGFSSASTAMFGVGSANITEADLGSANATMYGVDSAITTVFDFGSATTTKVDVGSANTTVFDFGSANTTVFDFGSATTTKVDVGSANTATAISHNGNATLPGFEDWATATQ